MFKLIKQKGLARRGVLQASHGEMQTPFFMPIATKGAVKTLSSDDMKDLGATIILSNTYHLLLRPGYDDLKKMGGLHKLMSWHGPLLTDSGGYQVFSLSKMNKITEDGVSFQSHIDGRRITLTPEGSMAMQGVIGSDIAMQFDHVAPATATHAEHEAAMERSLRWAQRCKDVQNTNQLLFSIVQGGTHQDLRAKSAEGLREIGFDGYAIGGLSVGEERAAAFATAKFTAGLLPENQPRYFMGGGMPEEIVYYVSVGIDMFDCVLPTRNARHGTLFVWKDDPAVVVKRALEIAQNGGNDIEIAEVLYERLNINNENSAFDERPLDAWADWPNSQNYSRAYIRHLFKTEEALGQRFATMQNVRFYLRLMEELRAALN